METLPEIRIGLCVGKARIINNVLDKVMLCLNPMYKEVLASMAKVNHNCVVNKLNWNRNEINKIDETPSSSIIKKMVKWEVSNGK